jgi:hypothetical protein
MMGKAKDNKMTTTNILPPNTRMIDAVIQCIQAVQIAYGVSFNDIRTPKKKDVFTVLARYALIQLLSSETKLSVREIEKIMNMSQGNSKRLKDAFKNNSPAFKALRDSVKTVYAEMVKLEYDEQIPF